MLRKLDMEDEPIRGPRRPEGRILMAWDGVIRRVNLHSVKVGSIVPEPLLSAINIGRVELTAFDKRLFRPRACAGVVFHIGILSCRLQIDEGSAPTVELWSFQVT